MLPERVPAFSLSLFPSADERDPWRAVCIKLTIRVVLCSASSRASTRRHDGRARVRRLAGAIAQDEERHEGGGDPEGGAEGPQVAARQTVSTHCHRPLPPPSVARVPRALSPRYRIAISAPRHDADTSLSARRGRSRGLSHLSDGDGENGDARQVRQRREIFRYGPRETHDVTDAYFVLRAHARRIVSGHERGYPILGEAPSRSFPHSASRSDTCCNRCRRSAARRGVRRAYSLFSQHRTVG